MYITIVLNARGCKMIDMKFVQGGRAVFTVSNGKGEHFTYKVKKHRTKDMYFNYILTGGADSYTYMGMFNTRSHTNSQGNKGMRETAKCVQVFNWAMKVIKGEKNLPDGYKIQHEGMCARCGRALTDPVSIETGFGPTCRNK